MAVTTFTPTLKHVDWVDNEDVVQAGGTNGFNVRFNQIMADLKEISTVIANVNETIVPIAPTTILTFAPSFFPNAGATPWNLTNGVAEKPVGPLQTGADGWMSVQLPDGTKIQSITVIGEKSGTIGINFTVRLALQPLTGGAFVTLASADLAAEPNPFQPTMPVNPAVSAVDNSTSKYLIFAKVSGADPSATATIRAIQIKVARV